MLKKIKSALIRVLISAFSLVVMFLMVRGEFFDAMTHLSKVNLVFIILALGVNFFSLGVVAWRTRVILAVQRIHLKFARIYYLWVISFFFNLFLPSAVGGDIAKAYYIAKDSGQKMASITSVFLDRFFGLMATISIGFVAYLLGRETIHDPKIGQILFWITGIVFVSVLFVLSRRFSKTAKHFLLKCSPKKAKDLLHRLFGALELYQNRKASFLFLYLNSICAQAFFIVMVYLLARSIHIDLPVTVFFLLMPLITIVSMLPSIGGLGVREAATVYLFKNYMMLEQAVALSLLFDFFIYGIGFVCGILYTVRGGASIQEIERIERSSEKV